MKFFFVPLFAALLLPFVMGGCEKPAAQGPDPKVLSQVIEDNARAFNNKDVDGVMATIHPKMEHFADLKDFIAQTFKAVTLKVAVSDLKVVTSSPEEARVSFKQTTDKITDAGTVPLNVVEGVHTLRPDDGKWKIFGTVNTNVTRLDQKPGEGSENAAPAAAAAPAPAPAPETAPAPAPAPAPASATSPSSATPEAPKPASPVEKPAQ
ncbi:hypothetical protein CfE428DRAFT_3479 [Chthoniobacter flavus Ellin428]|uniref:SnoaL-like domain-containing protein n=1 Tax=Chthoniobacter flavus Ellin428 TaxID=497964 RepID=B4D3J1_9BACT|nr:hypothetical protein [Chthoniobacter flavus]EDY18821.1 hypothetical protein CfE428DRAFT_3479 [Chthoniobacter flavus Ellin428]TCO93419.1 hypothetical protein EV701_104123 [Chthoniobacter flavus]